MSSGWVSQNSAFEPGGLWWCDCGERRNNRSDCSLPAVEPRAASSQLQRCDASARLGNITRQVLENIGNLQQQTVCNCNCGRQVVSGEHQVAAQF